VIALITWLIRRIIRVKSKNAYLGYIFGGLWLIGLICCIFLIGSVATDYRTKSGIEERVSISQPPSGKIYVKVSNERVNYYGRDWFGFDWDDRDAPFYGLSEDSLFLRTIQVRVVRSDDSNFHVQMVKFSRGSTPSTAEQYARNIKFSIAQTDSVLILPKGFTITRNTKFHNQQVVVIVEVPVGKKIELDRNVSNYNWFNVESGHRRGWSVDWDDNWDRSYSWNDNTEYIMTEKGLKSTRPNEDERTLEENDVDDKRQQLEDLERQRRELDKQREELQKSLQEDSSRYRYQQDTIITRPARERKVQNGEVEVKEVSYRPINVSSLLIERFNI
jgi:hypothetical protein